MPMSSGPTDSLDSLLEGPRAGIEPDLKIALYRLASEVKRRFDKGSAGSYDFLSTTLRALSRVKGTVHANIRMATLFDCGAFFFTNRHDKEALQCAIHLERLATRVQDRAWERKALMLKGIAFAHLGDFGAAVLNYAQALELARALGQTHAEVSVLTNLGTAFNYTGLYREAIPCFRKAIAQIALSDRADLTPYSASAHCNLAQSHLALGEFDLGIVAITKSLALSDEPADAVSHFNRAVRELTFVQLALELGSNAAARNHANRCLHHSK